MAFASWWYATHGGKTASGASKGKKGAETTEKRSVNTSNIDLPKSQTSGVSSVSKAQTSVASKAPTMKPAETKASSSQQQTHGVESQKRKRNKKKAAQKSKTEPEKVLQDKKADESQPVDPIEGKQKDPGGAKSPSKDSLGKEPKQPSSGKEASGQDAKSTQLASTKKAKANTDKKPLASKVAVGTAGTVTAAGLTAASAETKEHKLVSPVPVTAGSKPAEKSDLDTALDDLIDTLGSPEENEPPAPLYTGPEVSDPMSSLKIEELGKRESTIPPEYRKLLESKGDKITSPSVAVGELQPTMTDDDLADALASDFTCTTIPSAGEKEVRPKEPATKNELLQAHTTTSVSSSAPPKEKKPKLEEVTISDSALDALGDTLGMAEPEPEEDTSSFVEVEEPKAIERKEKKPGERDDTIPPEYRLKPTLDKDGKPLLPTPEEKPKPINETELIDEFSKDFVCPASSTENSKPTELADISKRRAVDEPTPIPKLIAASPIALPVQPLASPEVSTKPESTKPQNASGEEAISASAVPSVKSSAPIVTSPSTQATSEALEALSGSLGERDPAPEEKKPAVDKVKEKTKKDKHEKLGENEETIPPDYRLTEVKDKDGKPLLPKPEKKPQPLSESELLDALSEGFSCSAPASTTDTPVKSTGPPSKPAVPTEEVISSAATSAVHSSVPKQAAIPGRKELDDAADLLADSLGQREPDPDENKPVLDKVKEKVKAEHKDKLGERDDTIPPEYRHLLDSDEKGKPIKPTDKDGEKPKEQMKPDSDSAAIDALSGDFDHCGRSAVSQPPSTKEDKSKGAASSKPPRKEEKKSKTPKKAKEQSSAAKSEKQKKS
ncbi:calpastatin isoform X2 [Crotalus tigris]|uniref:calpastatin isoform X2 n=1 Tax=Crotalus tigris TaxID=88082 RepID=UPI00192F3DE6|nr:calpastatin isoform X2 [Crotalus tigris]